MAEVENSPSEETPQENEEEEPTTLLSLLDDFDTDIRFILISLVRVIPFLLLLLIIFLYQHAFGVIIGLCSIYFAYKINGFLKIQISLKETFDNVMLTNITLALLTHIGAVLYFYWKDLYRSFIFLPPLDPKTLWETVWIIFCNDYIICFISMLLKIVTIVFRGDLPQRSVQNRLSLIEVICQYYRSVLPISLWYSYFQRDEFHSLFSFTISTIYFFIKFNECSEYFQTTIQIVSMILFRRVLYGKRASDIDVAEMGGVCSICQERMKDPIKLDCQHIFCDECISQWFERKKTCPLCRVGNKFHSTIQLCRDGTTLITPFVY